MLIDEYDVPLAKANELGYYDEIECLIGGEIVQKEIHEEMIYHDLYVDMGNVWSVLFMTGYLTQRGRADGNLYNLVNL